ETSALFLKVRAAVQVSIINQDYDIALQYLNDYSAIVSFSSQPKDHAHLRDNAYLEFLFYQFVVNVYLTIFPSNDPLKYKDSNDTGSFKSLDGIYKKIAFYHNRNESLLASCPPEEPIESDDETSDEVCTELKFYWLSKILNLVVQFKRLDFEDFYKDFISILLASDKSMKFFVNELGVLKSRILSMFCIVIIFLKPFKDLSLLDIDKLDLIINLYTSDEQCYEYELYNQILVPLLQSNFALVKANLTLNEGFLNRFSAELGFSVPVSLTESSQFPKAFLQYVSSIIDYKNCLLIFSVIKQIPRLKLMKLLGYNLQETSEQKIIEINEQILLLISSLGLGKIGIGYQFDQDIYYNNGSRRELDAEELQDGLDELTNELRAESIAKMMKGVLLEK
ncbi:uncharacterized protein CANTADRAFT_39215, partial [Suhomyces tanzawaensis NRRL Y-17324]